MQTFWNKILNWASDTLFPWIQDNLPELVPFVRDAFCALDTVVISTHRNIKQAWEILREHLLKVLVEFELNIRFKWVKRITYYWVCKLKSKQVAVRKVVAEEIVDFGSLPSEVRQEWLKRGNTTQTVDVTLLRDRELGECERELISGEVEEIVDVDSLPDNVQQEWDVLSNSTTQNSSVEIQESHILKGWLANVLQEDWRADLQESRSQWLVKQEKSKLWVKIMTGFCLLQMLIAYLQIKVENIWLPKRKQN